LVLAVVLIGPGRAVGESQEMGRVVEIRSYNLKAGDATLRGLRRTHRREPAAPEDAMQTPATSTHDLNTLLRLNRDYVRSVQTSDVRRFKEILADDFLCSLPDGSLIDRERFLEQTALPARISNLDVHDVNVRVMGDFAIIHARTTFTGPDGNAGQGRYTDVWARGHGRWLAVSAHVTRK
jgi:ketosteroid isomerase-like protein